MKTNDLLHRVKLYIGQHHLLHNQDRCLVALSGGADSVALLLCLKQLGYQLEAVHCNFHLRGAESDRDERFCEALCKRLNVPFHKVHFDTQTYAKLHKVSIEMAARTLRYDYFEQLRQLLNCEAIAVAHHADDNAETILLNLVRGTGLKGLTGMQPRNGHIIRPLLCLSHQDLFDFLDEMGENHVEDSTNAEDEALRNRIRHKVLPALKEVNPAAVANINQTAERLSAAWVLLETELRNQSAWQKEENGSQSIPLKNVENEYALWYCLKDYGFNATQVETIHHSVFHADQPQTGLVWYSATHMLTLNRDCLQLIALVDLPEKAITLPIPALYIYDEKHRFKLNQAEFNSDYQISKEQNKVCLDADKIVFPLTIRPLQEGDRFVPFGMTGSKLVSDFLTDRKFSAIDKHLQLAVCDATGVIIWLAGLRPDNRFRVTESTKNVLELILTIQ